MVQQAVRDILEESDGEQSDELKDALLLMPEKRYTGNFSPDMPPVLLVQWLTRCRLSGRQLAERRKPSVLRPVPA